MNPDSNKLLSLNDVKAILKPKNEVYVGMRAVPIKLIVGSEGRYNDFNKYFLPRSNFMRHRWQNVDAALLQMITLPPIQLYEIGGVYFVRDGNHRVSVAKTQGVEQIDAEVISLASQVTVQPSMSVDEMSELVIKYEKQVFYENTFFGDLTDCFDLDFSMPGSYDVIYNHILVHKYYLNEGKEKEVSFNDALVSWYQNVYCPVIQIIKDEYLCLNFPKRTPSDLYVWIIKRWDFLKKKYGVEYALSDAALDFSREQGNRAGDFLRMLVTLPRRLFGKKTERKL
jgi:hypothetical protein